MLVQWLQNALHIKPVISWSWFLKLRGYHYYLIIYQKNHLKACCVSKWASLLWCLGNVLIPLVNHNQINEHTHSERVLVLFMKIAFSRFCLQTAYIKLTTLSLLTDLSNTCSVKLLYDHLQFSHQLHLVRSGSIIH